MITDENYKYISINKNPIGNCLTGSGEYWDFCATWGDSSSGTGIEQQQSPVLFQVNEQRN